VSTTVTPLPQIDAAAVAQRMLNAVVGYFTAQDWDLPERQYLAAGSPTILAADDEHLAIGLAAMHSGITPRSLNSSGAPSKGARSIHVPRADFKVRLMRCVATIDDSGQPPEPEELTADGLRLLADPGRLLTALFHWHDTDAEFTNTNPQVVVGDVDVIGPMGGLAGHAVSVTVGPVQ
jgi:hypothetical protein